MSVAATAAILIMEILRFGVMKSEIRMPNAERNPKSEARSQRRLGSPGNTQEAREGILPPATRDGWEAILRILDFGILSDFDLRNSDLPNRFFHRNPRFMTVHSKPELPQAQLTF